MFGMFYNIFVVLFNALGIIIFIDFVFGNNFINHNFNNFNNTTNIKAFVNKLNNNLIDISWEVLKVFGKICIF